MKTLNFLDEERSLYLNTENNDGTITVACYSSKSMPQIIPIPEPSENMEEANNKLIEYAKANNLKPALWHELEDDNNPKVYQADIIQKDDYIQIPDDELAEKGKVLAEHLYEIASIEAELDTEIKRLKNKAKAEIEEIKGYCEDLQIELTKGANTVKVNASWERDAENEMMLLIRRDNGNLLDWREMTVEEKAQTNLFDNEEEPETISNAPIVEDEDEKEFNTQCCDGSNCGWHGYMNIPGNLQCPNCGGDTQEIDTDIQ